MMSQKPTTIDTDREFTPEELWIIDGWVEAGLFLRVGDSFALTAAGHRFFGIPDDKSLLDIALEHLVDEVFSEEFEASAGRPFAAGKQ